MHEEMTLPLRCTKDTKEYKDISLSQVDRNMTSLIEGMHSQTHIFTLEGIKHFYILLHQKKSAQFDESSHPNDRYKQFYSLILPYKSPNHHNAR
ncbi:hypothetical protein PanWU01x14_032010 [Parasponia andersonii]|uniref:Uncharacterized protein n=1 Tax=Parasponia andersonii TaxID=3476 RepID=A0A2P5DUA7_PARAD|nr:hypothetical protein PanWU01x14_032010 [Parasponia andersonii]